MTHKILIVDDEPANLRMLERLFRPDFQVLSALSGKEALDVLTKHDVALIVTDQRMPEMTGVEFLKRAAELRRHTLRIILTGYTDVNTLVDAINSGVVYKYVTKPWINADLKQTVRRALEFYEANKRQHELERRFERLSESLAATEQSFTRFIAASQNCRDEASQGHARRTSAYATAIGAQLGLDREHLEELSLAAFFHNIGNDFARRAQSRNSPTIADVESRTSEFCDERTALMLQNAAHLSGLLPVIRHCPERFDGGGNPLGLSGEQIPLLSRIIAVAARYDEMTQNRRDGENLTHENALSRLADEAGARFDPAAVAALGEIETLKKIRFAIEQFASGERLFTERVFEDVDEIPVAELLRRIKTNPVLALEILRQANSAQTGAEPTAQLLVAAARLGEKKLRRLLRQQGFPFAQQPNLQFWSEHALRRAVVAQMLAAHTDLMNPDEAYALGLLCEVGAALLIDLFPDEAGELSSLAGERRARREIEIFGAETAQISQWTLTACNLPEKLTSSLGSKCDLMRSAAPASLLLFLADRIATAGDEYKVTVIDSFEPDVLSILRLSRNDLNKIYESASAICSEMLESQQIIFEFA